jgi:hypothetical protein
MLALFPQPRPKERCMRRHLRFSMVCGAALVFSLQLAARSASAQPEPPAEAADPPGYKLTVGHYRAGASGQATDLNLRRALGTGNAWLGLYDAPVQDERQWRLGADANLQWGSLRWMPAAQLASHRYAAASLGVETGERWFVGVGFGRTNLRPNTNLNFDPNDSYSLSAGLREAGGASYQVQWVRDNRLNPDQRHLHLVYRTTLPDSQRLTVDLLFKQGLVDDASIRSWGASVGYDWPTVFARVACDPHVNFTADTMWRLSAGARF